MGTTAPDPEPSLPAAPAGEAARLRGRSRGRKVRGVALRFIVLYSIVLLLTFVGCTDRLILFPTTEPIRLPGIERVGITGSSGREVEVWTARSAGAVRAGEPPAFVLTFPGNADRAERLAYYVAGEWGDRPVEVWAVNYPGYGGSAGAARLKDIGPAALAAYDALAARAGGRPIFVDAQSIGTTAALHVAASRPVAGCVLKNPPALRQLILGEFGWWNLWLLAAPVACTIPSDLDSLANARRVTAPAVIVSAERDEVVPRKYHQRVADAYAGQKRVISLTGAYHNDPIEGGALPTYEAAVDWLWESAKISPARQP